MSHASSKRQKIEQIELILWDNPGGLTRSALARRIDVDPGTITKYLKNGDLPHVYEDGDKLKLDRYGNWARMVFELEEITMLHIGARLLVRQTNQYNPYVASVLRKFARVINRTDEDISHHLSTAASSVDDELQRRNKEYLNTLQKLTDARNRRRKVTLDYELDDGKLIAYTFTPFFIEPYAPGLTTHVIGLREPPGKIRTFKLERLCNVKVSLEDAATVPDDFDPEALLEYAWGIWYTNEPPELVELKFAPRVKRRVLETRWHRKQEEPEVLADGSVIWRCPIAEPREMIYWIRGWGADVEVIEPAWLREDIKREARRLGELYQVTEVKKQFVAHIRKKDNEHQSLQEHLSAVSKLTGQFAQKIGLKETGIVLGLLHDLGKASDRFQRYILSGEGLIDPDAEEYIDPIAHKGKIDHTTAGAQVVYQNLWSKGPKEKIAAQVLALCIASHHSGLIDCLTPNGENNFKRRMEKPDESTCKTEALTNLQDIQNSLEGLFHNGIVEHIYMKLQSLQEERGDSRETSVFKAGLIIRFLLSCLIDADRLDTADFEAPYNSRLRNYGEYRTWETLILRLNSKVDEFERKPNRNEVDELRSQVSHACLNFATKPKGIYQLTVPTGGAKTLGSLRFALNHTMHHGMDRIFYVIPYTSIIDQNADEVRKILEDKDEKGQHLDKVVLEHHSNLTPEEETHRQNLLAENWDAPVVFTTQVQFLEVLFGAGTRSPRRMHQLANSVIILDEVQSIPIKTVHMLNVALRFLVNDCGATVVLCTATQPPLDKLDTKHRSLTIQPDQRIIQNENELFEGLKRVDVFDERKIGGWSEEEVADLAEQQLQEKGSVLIVVNTKKSARALYHAIAAKEIADVKLRHLSTNMCPVHRLQVLDEIKSQLQQGERVICVSTQLIEAGVDIDFGSVIRYLAGLDSIAQSAGRCNRHGMRAGLGRVWVINPKEENIGKLQDIVIGTTQAQRVLDDFKDDPQSFGNDRIGIEAMAAYYKYYYNQRKDDMRYNVGADSPVGRSDNLFNLLSTNMQSMEAYRRTHDTAPDVVFPQSFQTAAKAFCVIDSPTRGVVVSYKDDGKKIVAELCAAGELAQQRKLLRRAQRYSVNLFPNEFQQLAMTGAIQEVQAGTGVYYLDEQYYSDKFGWSDKPVKDMELLSI